MADINIGIRLLEMESGWSYRVRWHRLGAPRWWLHRVRWRRRGAWLWPVFVAAIALDSVLEHLRPPAGDTQSVASAALVGLLLNLLGVLLLSRPLGALIRRVRGDLPGVVARNYAGTTVVVAVSSGLLVAGLVHHSTVVANANALRDATVRAQAWIGDRAPSDFRRHVNRPDTFVIVAGSLYRTCVPSRDFNRSYCVIVKTQLPFARSVRFAGYTPNAVFAQGAG
jgi:hypothetical protein